MTNGGVLEADLVLQTAVQLRHQFHRLGLFLWIEGGEADEGVENGVAAVVCVAQLRSVSKQHVHHVKVEGQGRDGQGEATQQDCGVDCRRLVLRRKE